VIRSPRRVWCLALGLGAAVMGGGGGCQSGYRDFAQQLDQRIAAGDFTGAAQLAAARAEKAAGDRNNRVVYNLEAARATQMAGDLEASRDFFGRVHADVRPFLDTKAEDRVSQAVTTTVVNQTTSTFIGTPVDRIMATALNAINQMGVGDLEEARVQLNLTREWQEEAVRRLGGGTNPTGDLEDEAKRQGVGVDADRVDGIMATHFAELADLRADSEFRNPFASHLRGVFLLATAADPSDTERARFELRQVLSMEPDALPAVGPDLDRIETGGSTAPTVWIYVMAGRGPWLEELRLDLPIPFGNVNYVSAAFPRLRFHDDSIGGVSVTADGTESAAVLLADVDAMVGAEFKARLPRIIMQEILSSALKAGATYAIRDEAGGWGQLISILYQAFSTSADTRMWRTLPKRVLLARVPTPADGLLTARYAGVSEAILVEPGRSHIIVLTVPHAGVRQPSVVRAALTPARIGQETSP
jgi:uncharacterized protein